MTDYFNDISMSIECPPTNDFDVYKDMSGIARNDFAFCTGVSEPYNIIALGRHDGKITR
eukprot:CAMPEP_0201691150 /NCGR_PEP_ID=MMETSP0578-20130828/4398_1 /ASSEMBLY_ACC=CAM_ASM_000663 /TAXON_ID=267565 /ORGANISM="Skeletonema grethea, Strain CCMP 1804" /LENGTH=58 /DNA_ID=CAMNT_0048176305 /DNA_START=72 /DNA_END=248 /DNA_ORIENTATION=+